MKTFKTLQHNITCILHINSSNKTFVQSMILLFLWLIQKLKDKSLLSLQKKRNFPARFSVKFVKLPAQSIALANWFACVLACTNAIARVSLTSLNHCEKYILLIIYYINYVRQLFKIDGKAKLWTELKNVFHLYILSRAHYV